MWVLYLNDEPNIQAQFSRTACIFNDGLEISISLSKECNIQSIQSNLAWSDILLLNDITYKKILRYIIQSKVQTVEAITEGRNESQRPLCFEIFFRIANNLKKQFKWRLPKQRNKSNNCHVVSFRNIERDLVFKLLDVGWEHSRSNKVLWGIGPAFWLENWGWMRRSWFWTGYCTFICKVQRGKRQCSAISIGQNILSLTSTPSMNYFELKRRTEEVAIPPKSYLP